MAYAAMWDRLEARLLAMLAAGQEVDADEAHQQLDEQLWAPEDDTTADDVDPDLQEAKVSLGLR